MCPLPEDLSPEGRKGVDQSQPCVSSGDVETSAQPMSIRLHPSRHPECQLQAEPDLEGSWQPRGPCMAPTSMRVTNTFPGPRREGADVGKAESTPKPGSLAQSPAHSLLPGPENQGRI